MNELALTGALVSERLGALMARMCEPGLLRDAMSYSLLCGGKRLRPALCLLSAGMYGDREKALDFACAIEMIHTYSLIHDDLPAMDNDVLRRGKPTNHVVFGEGFALLAGDGLLNCAYEVMLRGAREDGGGGLDWLRAMHIVASAAGVTGMIAGQAADMAFEGKDLHEEALRYIHERKTGALIKASVTSGAALLGAGAEDIDALGRYGECIGLVFQIVDDILDVEGSAENLGKSVGKDKDSGKLTFARAYGVGESRRIARSLTDEALLALARFGDRALPLAAAARQLLERDR